MSPFFLLICLSIFHFNPITCQLDQPPQSDPKTFLPNLILGRFDIDDYAHFLQNLPINITNEEKAKLEINETLNIMTRKEDLIKKSVYHYFNIRHNTGDMDKALLLNTKIMFLKTVYKLIPSNNTEFKNFTLNLRPNGSDMAWSFPGALPNFLLFIPFGINQSYYTSFSRFPQVKLNDFNSINFTGLQQGENLEPHAKYVKIDNRQICGSCMAFASAAVLSNFYVREYFRHFNKTASDTTIYNFTANPFFVDAYQLLACTNFELPVPKNLLFEHQFLFEKSNGYFMGHGCYGNMSPEILFWAMHNNEKIGIFDDVFNKLPEFNDTIRNYGVKLGKFCDLIQQKVKKIEDPLIAFPNFTVKYVSKALFNGLNRKQMAESLMKLVLKYGFVFISLFYDTGSLFDCGVFDYDRDSMETYHYVALAGVDYEKETDDYYALIQNSWGEPNHRRIKIYDGYVGCNALNAMMVLEPKN